MLMMLTWYILKEAQYWSFEIKRPEKLHVCDDDSTENIMMIMIILIMLTFVMIVTMTIAMVILMMMLVKPKSFDDYHNAFQDGQ